MYVLMSGRIKGKCFANTILVYIGVDKKEYMEV